MNIRQSEEFKRREDVGELTSLRLTEMRFTLTEDSAEKTFNWVDSISIEAKQKGGARRVLVAYLHEVPEDASTISLKPTRNQLIDIVGVDFEMVVTLQGRFPAQVAKFTGRSVFEVRADPAGIF